MNNSKIKSIVNKVTNSRLLWVIFIIVSLILFLTQAEFFVRSDGFYYYHTAKSIVDHGSFVTTEEPTYWDTAAPWTRTVLEDRYISVASPGTAILNVPALFVSKVVDQFIDLDDNYFLEYNGHTLLEGIFMVVNSYIFFVASLILIFKILRGLGFSERNSLVSISLSIFSSYVLWYVFVLPIFTHVYELFFASLLLFCFLKIKNNSEMKYLLLMGISSGLLFLIRPIFLLLILVFWLFVLHKKNRIKKAICLFLSFVPFLALYFIYNLVSYGNFFTSGYSATGIVFDLSTFNGLNILFSIHRGWLVYSPIFIFALFGLLLGLITKRLIFVVCWISILLGVAIYGFWPNWWGGGSYGSRFLIYTLPFSAIGLSYFINKIKYSKYRLVVIFLMTLFFIYSTSLFFLYRVTPLKSDFYLPSYFFEIQIKRLNESQSIKDYISKNLMNVQWGSTIPIIISGRMDYLMRFDIYEDKLYLTSIVKPKISNQELPSALDLYLVNKSDREVYKLRFSNMNISQKIDIDCDIHCEKVTEIVDSGFEISRFSGVVLNESYDLYIENGQNVQLRGEPKTWNDWEVFHKIF